MEGIGRYRLREELLIGSGTAKSLITKLNKNIHFISVISNKNQKKGHQLTQKGKNYLNKFKKIIPILKQGDLDILKDILIDFKEIFAFFCLIKNAAKNITNGIAQRDAAIKINGSGATCLIYKDYKFKFPTSSLPNDDMNDVDISKNVQEYFKKELIDFNLESNDVIIIGSGDSSQKARLATMNAALTLI